MYITLKSTAKKLIPSSTWDRLYARYSRHIRPFTTEHCPLILPWTSNAWRNDAVSQLHRVAVSFGGGDRPSPGFALCVLAAALLWPFRFLSEAWNVVRTYGPHVCKTHSLSCRKQFVDIVSHGLQANIPAISYYRYRLFEPENARRARLYLHKDELDGLYEALMRHLPPDTPLSHKEAFFESGRENGLAVVDTIAAFADGAVQKWYSPHRFELPSCDLTLKPVDLLCGRGFQAWRYDEERNGWNRNETLLDAPQFVQYCCTVSRDKGYILQRRLNNHPALAGLGPRGLCTIRVVTYRRPSGESGLLMACFRMPTGSCEVDNFEAGGIAAPVEPETGILGRAVAKDPTRGTFDHHPDTGAPILGVRVLYFAEAVALALRAHACYAWVPFVGWDVVVTSAGPLLLEANPSWCLELAQIAPNRPLGETLYPEIFLEHITAKRQGPL